MSLNGIKVIKSFLALLTIIILGGCAGGVHMLPTLSEKNTPKSEEGVVVVRVINASAYPLPFNQFTIAPKNLNESDKIKPSRLQALPIATTNSTIFSSPVKAGSYSLNSVRSFHLRGEFWYSRWAEADAQFGTFNVNPGQVTDLGTIIYYPKPEKDKYINTLLRHPTIEKGKTLQQHFPFYSFNNDEVVTWSEDEYQEQREAVYASIVQNPVTFHTQYLAPNNTVYFIGKLGVILSRTSDKEWELDAVDSDLDLSAIVQNEAGDLVVGGDEGTIFYKPLGGEWQNISIDNSHHIEDFYFDSNGILNVVSRQETKLHVMSLESLAGQWHTKTTYDHVKGWQNTNPEFQVAIEPEEKKEYTSTNKHKNKKKPKRIVSAELSNDQDKHIIAVKYQHMRENFAFGTGDTDKYVYDPISWQINPYKSDINIDRMFNAGASKIGIEYAGFWSWTGKSTYYKQDNHSQEWQKITTSIDKCKKESSEIKGNMCIDQDSKKPVKVTKESFSFTSIPWFSDNTHGVAIVSFSDYNFWTGKRSNKTKIIETFDAGKTWIVTENELPNKFCTQIVNEVKSSLLLSCKGVSSDFYESLDNGKSWTLVHEQENF